MALSTNLLDLLVRVSLLFAAAALLAYLLRRSSAATRHLVWTFALAASLALPVAAFLAPQWEVPVLPADARLSDAEPLTGPVARSPISRVPERETSAGADRVPSSSRPSPAFASPAAGFRSAVRSWPLAAAAWALGALAVLLRLGIGSLRMWVIARRARPVSDGTWLRLARRLAGALGVRRRVVFLEGTLSAMPMTWGLWRSRVLLPEAAHGWPVARQRVVLLHELAHVKRRDCLTQLLAQAVCAVYWFHPLAWFAARQLRTERERACDDLVLAAGTRGSEYADHLLEIARVLRSVALPTWAAVAMAHRSQLEGRLMAILDPEVPRRFPTKRRSFFLASAVIVMALPIALITPVPQAAEAITAVEPGSTVAQTLPLPAPTATPAPTPTPTPAPVGKGRDSDSARAAREATKQMRFEGSIPRMAAQAVAQALGTGDAIAQAVSDGVDEGIRGALQEGQRSSADPRAVAALVEALKDSDREVREQAMQALARMRAPEALDAIRAALGDQNPSVREQAAFALGQYRDRTSVDALVAALKDSSADVREQAVFALGQIKESRAGDALAATLKDADADVREQAAFALGQLRYRAAVEALGASLKDSSASVREQAAFALGQIRDARAVDALVVALRNESASVREQAAFALGQIGDARAIEGLTAALKDASAEVRRQAAFALGQISR